MNISFWRLPFSILQEKTDGMNLKTGQYKISKLKSRAGKIFFKKTGIQGPMGQYQKSYYSFFEVPEEKIMVQKKIPRKTVVEIF